MSMKNVRKKGFKNNKVLFGVNKKNQKFKINTPISKSFVCRLNLATMAWAQGLLASMKDPDLKVISTDELVAIKDKYPKAKYHYLIIPHENIRSIFYVNDTFK